MYILIQRYGKWYKLEGRKDLFGFLVWGYVKRIARSGAVSKKT